jgi:hypothetical protein
MSVTVQHGIGFWAFEQSIMYRMQRIQELVAQTGLPGLVTIRKRPRCRRLPPAGRGLASPSAVANSAKDLIPRDADRSLDLEVIQAPIEFFALGLCKRDGLRRDRQAIP